MKKGFNKVQESNTGVAKCCKMISTCTQAPNRAIGLLDPGDLYIPGPVIKGGRFKIIYCNAKWENKVATNRVPCTPGPGKARCRVSAAATCNSVAFPANLVKTNRIKSAMATKIFKSYISKNRFGESRIIPSIHFGNPILDKIFLS